MPRPVSYTHLVGRVERLTVVRALPGQGISLHPRRKAADGPAVCDGEVGVGLGQQGGDPLVRCKLRRGGLPSGGKAPCEMCIRDRSRP